MTTARRKAGFFIQIYGSSLEPFIQSLNRTRRSRCAIRKKIPSDGRDSFISLPDSFRLPLFLRCGFVYRPAETWSTLYPDIYS